MRFKCGEGACPRSAAQQSQSQRPCSVRGNAEPGFGAASRPNGGKPPRHNWPNRRLRVGLEHRVVFAQLDLYRFDPGEVVQRADAVLTADTRLLVAANRHLGVGLAPGVDPADTGFQLMNHAVGAVQVLGDYTGGQAEVGVVGATDHFFFGFVAEDAHHRAEDFFADDGHVIAAIGEHGRRDKGALGEFTGGQAFATTQQARAFFLALGDVAQHAFHMGEADQGAEVGVLVFRVADADPRHTLDDLGFESGFQMARHKHTGAIGADLAGAVEVGHHRGVGGAVEVGVVENDQRRLAAQFHGHVLERRAGSAGHDFLAGVGAAGEGDFLDARVLGQPGADFTAAAGQNVEHAVRYAGRGVDLGQFQGGQRSDFNGLEDHRVAGGQGRGGFPQGDLDRVVPRADTGDHAQRLATGVDERSGAQRDLLAFDRRHQASVIFQHVGTGDDVDITGFRVSLAGVQGFQGGQFVVALTEDVDGATQDARTLHGGHRGPDFLALLGTDHGPLDVVLGRALHFGENFTVGRVDGIESGIAAGVGVTAVDVEFLQFETGHSVLASA